MIKKVEVLANVAVIITAVIFCSVLVRKYYFPRDTKTVETTLPSVVASAPTRPSIKPDQQVSLPDIDWSKANRTILLALSTKCRFCTESAPFYQQILQKKSKDVRVVVVLPQPVEESRKYLDKLGVSVREVKEARLATVGVSGTPTVILIDKNGVVQNLWIGKLSDVDAQGVLEVIGKN